MNNLPSPYLWRGAGGEVKKSACPLQNMRFIAVSTGNYLNSALKYSLRMIAMASMEIPFGQTASHSAWFEQSPKPSTPFAQPSPMSGFFSQARLAARAPGEQF